MSKHINLIKLSVGTESVEELDAWQQMRPAATDGLSRHVTRMWPKRESEITQGGSIYWVIKGVIQARQQILRFDEVIGDDGIRRCAIVMKPGLIRTQHALKRPFKAGGISNLKMLPRIFQKAAYTKSQCPLNLAQHLPKLGSGEL